MLTIELLQNLGANTKDGLGRCLNNETMYLKFVNMALEDANFERLSRAIAADDRHDAFEAAHALKGVLGNLSLTPLYETASEMTELLRTQKDADYSAYLEKLLAKRDELKNA